MSVESLAAVLHHSRARGTAKLVLVGIANHDGDGGAWPAVATLATYANVTPRNVQAALSKLVSLGELVVELQAGGLASTEDHERPNLYHITVTCPPWCDRTHQHRDTRATRQAGLPPVAIDTPPLSESTPPPLSESTPEPPTKPNPPSVSTQPQHARAMCSVCSAPDELVCYDRQRKLATEDRHTYTEVRRATG